MRSPDRYGPHGRGLVEGNQVFMVTPETLPSGAIEYDLRAGTLLTDTHFSCGRPRAELLVRPWTDLTLDDGSRPTEVYSPYELLTETDVCHKILELSGDDLYPHILSMDISEIYADVELRNHLIFGLWVVSATRKFTQTKQPRNCRRSIAVASEFPDL